MLARRFLWIVTGLILLVIAGAFAYRLFSPQLMRAAFVPAGKFEGDRGSGPDYSRPDMWIARPDLAGNPAMWVPPGVARQSGDRASIFFVHPTSYLDRKHWNAPLDDRDSQDRARIFVQSQASAFNGIGPIWAPRYRQATIGAFLTDQPDAGLAFALAYRDVRAAFEEFLKEAPADRPIILAGHSQGSFLLSRLLADRAVTASLDRRIAMAYLIGWPLSITADLPRLGLPPCARAGQSGCIVSWVSYGEPADPDKFMNLFHRSRTAGSRTAAATPILCVNPLTGNQGDAADASANLGMLIPDAQLNGATLKAGVVPARCDPQGLLLIGTGPDGLPPYVLPGNNYHVFDYALYWANLRGDADRRLANFK